MKEHANSRICQLITRLMRPYIRWSALNRLICRTAGSAARITDNSTTDDFRVVWSLCLKSNLRYKARVILVRFVNFSDCFVAHA